MPTNLSIRRGAQSVSPSVLKSLPPMPRFEVECPDLVRKFPELKRMDDRWARWFDQAIALQAKQQT